MNMFFLQILLFSLAISTALPQVSSKHKRYTINTEPRKNLCNITILLQQYNGLKNILQQYGYDVIQNGQTGPRTGLLPWFQNAIGTRGLKGFVLNRAARNGTIQYTYLQNYQIDFFHL